jgi:phage baseplate assembly protein V
VNELAGLFRRLLFMVTRGRVLLVDDAKPAQLLQLRLGADWVQDEIPRLAEYGFQSHPPDGSDAVVACLAGNPTDAVVVATGHQTYRIRDLGKGEVAISDDKGQLVHLSADGIKIDGAGLPITINAPAGVTINGPLTINGAVTNNGKNISATHKHTGGTIAGLTGVVQ